MEKGPGPAGPPREPSRRLAVTPGPLELLAAISNGASAPSARNAVTTSRDVVGNDKVTCYQLAAPGQTYVLCAAATGAPELIANTAVRYELITASPSVPASVFTP